MDCKRCGELNRTCFSCAMRKKVERISQQQWDESDIVAICQFVMAWNERREQKG